MPSANAPELERRELVLETLEVRNTAEGRTLDVRAVPYGRTVDLGALKERFMHGAFRAFVQARSPVRLFWNHDRRSFPVGKSIGFDEKRDGLYGSFVLSRSQRGEEALTLVEEGILDSVSIGFEDIRHRRAPDGAIERTKSWLHELSLVDSPAYADARILAVRSADDAAEEAQRAKADELREWVRSLRA